LEKFLNGEAIDEDALITRMWFGAIAEHVEDSMGRHADGFEDVDGEKRAQGVPRWMGT
jgi:hypothetical protein